jgi:hypothetical protein
MIEAKSARSNESKQAGKRENDDRGDHDRVVGPFFNSLLAADAKAPATLPVSAFRPCTTHHSSDQ